jgi:hypothetical protein
MSNGNNTHWTEDEELLEHYVLGHLDAAARAPLDDHLHHCALCREKLRRERIVAAGIQQLGRSSLRNRLAHRLEPATPSPVPWTRILAAAAVITIIVGVGTYYRWFATQQPHDTTDMVTSETAGPKDRANTAHEKEQLAGKSETSGEDAGVLQEELRASDERQVQIAQAPPVKVPQAQAEYRRNEKKTTGNIASTKTEEPDRQESAVNRLDTVGDKQSFAANAAGAEAAGRSGSTDALWVDGVVLTEARGFGQSMRDLESLSSVRKDEASAKPAPAAVAGEAGRRKTADRYSVVRKPLSSLPISQQTRQQYLGATTVQTEIQRVNGTIQLTLFTDVAADSTGAGQAVVQEAGGDSLIVLIDSQTVVYRLPSGWHETISRH